MEQGEIVIYKTTDENNFQLEVRVEDETVWLTQAQMADLFQTTRNNVTLHISNVFKENELQENSVCKDSLLTASDGKKYKTKLYNLDVKRYNAQYPKIEVKQFTKAHDRFLIIDNETVYHIGASLKDLGKKWFAFSKINLDAQEMIKKLTVAPE